MRRAASAILAVCLLCCPVLADEDSEETEEPAEVVPDQDETAVLPGSATVTEALQGKEGVRIQTLCTHCNSANIQVGGLSSELAPIAVDGYPIFGGLATSMVFTIMPADTIIDAKIVRGPGQALSPSPAAGGYITLAGATGHDLPLLDIAAEAGSFSRERYTGRVAGAAGKVFSGALVAGLEKADPVDADDDGFNDVGSVDRTFADGRFELTPGKKHKLNMGVNWIDEENLDGRGAYDFFAGISNPGEDSWTHEDAIFNRLELRGGWEWALGNGRQLDVRILDANREQALVSVLTEDPAYEETTFGEPFERFNIEDHNQWGQIRYSHPGGLNWMLQAGIEAQAQEVKAASIDPLFSEEPETATDTVSSESAWADFDWKATPKWNFLFGLRYDDAEWVAEDVPDPDGDPGEAETIEIARSDNRLLPRVTIGFTPSHAWTLKAIAGETFRAPTPILAEVCCGQAYQRNINTLAETGQTLGFEGIYQPSPKLRASVYVARTDFDEHILRMVGWSFAYLQTYALANIPSTRAEAAEVVLRWTPHPIVTLDGSIGWLSHFNTGDPDITLAVTPPSFGVPQEVVVAIDRVPYEPQRTGSVSAAFSLPKGISLGVAASYTGSMLIQQYDDEPFFPGNHLDGMRPTPSFWMAGISIVAPIGKHIEVFGGFDNLTDEVQTDLGDPTVDYNWGPLTGRSWRLGLRYRLR